MLKPALTELEFRRHVSTQLLKLRKKHRYSQQNIAWALYISQSYYHQIESGKSTLSLYLLIKLANFYGISIQELLEG